MSELESAPTVLTAKRTKNPNIYTIEDVPAIEFRVTTSDRVTTVPLASEHTETLAFPLYVRVPEAYPSGEANLQVLHPETDTLRQMAQTIKRLEQLSPDNTLAEDMVNEASRIQQEYCQAVATSSTFLKDALSERGFNPADIIGLTVLANNVSITIPAE